MQRYLLAAFAVLLKLKFFFGIELIFFSNIVISLANRTLESKAGSLTFFSHMGNYSENWLQIQLGELNHQ